MKSAFSNLMQKGLNKISVLKRFFESQKREAEYQKIASSYWQSSSNSYIGSEDLYVKQEEALTRWFVPKVSEDDEILDIGCSNGRFTFLVYKHCRRVDAFDLSPHLIQLAKEQAERDRAKNIAFTVQDIQDLKTVKTYDHVMCMGVFTAIPDEKIVKAAALKIAKIVKENGYLVLKDSLASSDTQVYVNKDYAARYRNEAEYKSMLEQIGFRIETEEVLHTSYLFDQEISSKFLLLKKGSLLVHE